MYGSLRDLLTPPSSSEDSSVLSPQSGSASPQSDEVFSNSILITDPMQPRLRIVEQPVDKFRFRYKSEMSGTHGSLTGINSDKTRKQTFPTVELLNYDQAAVIRCTLYQYSPNNQLFSQPHAHRLVKRHGNIEYDDPHSIPVSPQEGFRATFHSMGIIHTAKKYIVNELYRKKKLLKEEEISLQSRQKKELTQAEIVELKNQAEWESKSINLNIVCLRFEAFKVLNDIYYPICRPVYSHPINNLKSALTGELKIVRMDRCHSPASGNYEVFLLVEKVTKKNIRVRLYELDDDDVEVWSAYGKFSDLDVHHQYAIVFKTPPYKDLELQEHRKVYIELERPSDGARSEPKEFNYVPSKIKSGSKRPRHCYSSFSSSGEFSSNELPTVLPYRNSPQNSESITPMVDSGELNRFIEKVQQNEDIPTLEVSEDFIEKMCNQFEPIRDLFSSEPVFISNMDTSNFGPIDMMNPLMLQHEMDTCLDGVKHNTSDNRTKSKRNSKDEDEKLLKDIPRDLYNFIRTNPTKPTSQEYLKNIFSKRVNSENNNILHIAILRNEMNILESILKVLRQLDLVHLLDNQNEDGKTPLHFAVECQDQRVAFILIEAGATLKIQDNKGNTPLHLAVMKSLTNLVKRMLKESYVKTDVINKHNNDGFTPLHLAVKICKLPIVQVLYEHGADVNEIERKSGRTCLHSAILDKNFEIVQYLLDRPNIDLIKEDYNGDTPYAAAKSTVTINSNKIYDLLISSMDKRGVYVDEKDIKMEEDDENSLQETTTIFIKQENDPDEIHSLYQCITEFEEDALNNISALLDTSGQYEELSNLLGLEHLVDLNILEGPSPTKSLLEYAVYKNGVSMWTIRENLEKLEESSAVHILDEMTISMPK